MCKSGGQVSPDNLNSAARDHVCFRSSGGTRASHLPFSPHLTLPQATATKAAKKELERDLDGAFELYISAARAFLQLANAHPELNATARAEANKSLGRAEKIKRAKPSVQPMARDAFAAGEQALV